MGFSTPSGVGSLPLSGGTLTGSLTFSDGSVWSSTGVTIALTKTLTYGGVTAASTVTGTGSLVLAVAPSITLANGSGLPPAGITGDLGNTVNHTSWTPTDQSGSSLSFSNVSANYTQIGNMVFAYFSLTYPTTSVSVAAVIGGLPITSANANYANLPFYLTLSASIGAGIIGVVNKAATTFAVENHQTYAVIQNQSLSAKTVAGVAIYPAA